MRAVISILVVGFFSVASVQAQTPHKSGEQLLNEISQRIDPNASTRSAVELLNRLSPEEQSILNLYAIQLKETNPSLAASAERVAQRIQKGEQLTLADAVAASYDKQNYACLDGCLTLAVFAVIVVLIALSLPSVEYTPSGKPIF